MEPERAFKEDWAVDFEYTAPPGECPDPVCMAAYEWRTGHEIRLWWDELRRLHKPPFDIGPDSCVIAYYAPAEMNCFLALGWPLPENVIDLYAEFRVQTNGKTLPAGKSLLGALSHFRLPAMPTEQKDEMRNLVMRGGPWTAVEKDQIIEYCGEDVRVLSPLWAKLAPHTSIPHALLRGEYMKSVARMETTGTPIDTDALRGLKTYWADIQDVLIERIDRDYGVFDGRTFKIDRWARFLADHGIPWPRLPSGQLNLRDETFKDMARAYPTIAPIRELRGALSQMRLFDLPVGLDGRNRCMLSPVSSRTGRNQPSTSQFIFGPSPWLRSLIKPEPGQALAYVDYSQQEFGVAAALSSDEAMKQAYASGDPYLEFAKQAGAVPVDATKQSHPNERDLFKACVLAVQYGMGAKSLSFRIGGSEAQAAELLRLHRKTYPAFWRWSDGAADYGGLFRRLWTTFGWSIHLEGPTNTRALRNWPVQSNGAEMLRLAIIGAHERGVEICCPIHDAVLVQFPLDHEHEAIAATIEAMTEASTVVLAGFPLRVDTEIVRYPDRYQDKRGVRMWSEVWGIIEELRSDGSV